ncbi:hypothetical protein SO802_022483 [Lithocarpus litseifolius]|uniref:Uncharacterized protein n=1 Tax=Lithocarpus litseifolius TaxID=425828 RepID=A0AAW2C3C5_9ROSI
MPHGFDNTWGIVKDSASIRPHISDEQKAFIHRVTEIPFGEQKCQDLITLDTLHTYCREMEAGRQRAMVRATATNRKKEKDGGSLSAPKDVIKGTSKWRSDGKDDHPLKKGLGATVGHKKPKKPSPLKPNHGAGYAIEMVESIIKETDVDPCAEQETEDLGASGLFDPSRALVRMKALQDRCAARKGVISHLRKRNETLTNEQDQYKDALRTLNKEPFIDSCAVYYGDGLKDCVKQVKSIYAYLDLSKVTLDDPLPSTPAGDTVLEENDDSPRSERDPKDDGVVLAQPAVEKPDTPLIKAQDVEDPCAQDPLSKADENPPAHDVQDPLV